MSVTIEMPAAVGDMVPEELRQNVPALNAETSTVRRRDPTLEEIAAARLEIQATWSDSERWARMRADMRPYFRRADGVPVEMSEAAYREHLEKA